MKYYQEYPAAAYAGLDFSKIHPHVRWNLSGTALIVQFYDEPEHPYLTHEEALAIVSNGEWFDENEIFIDTDE